MSDEIISDWLDALDGLTPADSLARREREEQSRARFRKARERLDLYFLHEVLEPLEREVTWGIVAAGLELAHARAAGGVDALRQQIEVTTIDERFGHFMEALYLMRDWCRGVVNGSIRGGVEEMVLRAIAEAEPAQRFFRAVAGLLAVGVDEALSAEEMARELAPVFREKGSLFPSRSQITHEIQDLEIESIGRLEYTDDSIGFRVGEFGAREYQQSAADPDIVYVVDEFLTLLAVNLKSGRSRVIAELYGPLTHRRRAKLRSRGLEINERYPMEHIFYFDEASDLLYVAAHTRLLEVWNVRTKRRLYRTLLPDQAYAIDQIRQGHVIIAVRGAGFVAFDGEKLSVVTGAVGSKVEFVAASVSRWQGYSVYMVRNGLLFLGPSGKPGGLLKLPGAEHDRVASVCLLPEEIVITTWDKKLHIFRGTGMPWDGWKADSRSLAHYVCVAPDAPWGVVFDHHTTSTAWSGPWSYRIVEDVRTVDERCERTQVIEQRGLVQSIPDPLREGRLVIWNESSLTASIDVGTRQGTTGRLHVQTVGPAYQESLTAPDGTVVAFRDWLSPCSLAVVDSEGTTLRRTEFPSVSALVSLDPVAETLTLRGRSKADDELTTEELDTPGRLELWTWHWPTDSWTSSVPTFHGFRRRPFRGREELLLYLESNRDLVYLGVAGLRSLLIEERPEEELIIVNDAVRRVSESSGEAQVHPLRPLLYGRILDEIRLEISTETDRAWISEPGGIISGYSLHDAKRNWRVRLPETNAQDRAEPVKLNRVPGMRDVLTLRTEEGEVFLLDAETGDIVLALSFESAQREAGFLPVLTQEALLLPVGYEVWGWPLSKDVHDRLTRPWADA